MEEGSGGFRVKKLSTSATARQLMIRSLCDLSQYESQGHTNFENSAQRPMDLHRPRIFTVSEAHDGFDRPENINVYTLGSDSMCVQHILI